VQPGHPDLYPNLRESSGHRGDIATWVRYPGAILGTATIGSEWPAWSTPATTALFALALWAALDSHFRIEQLP
jgi:hypothetical protein